jgi:2-dehydro-3-deoxyphosphogluconate aldolase/(4S)-4-hydroxy-2-oxoglutarate aldolase
VGTDLTDVHNSLLIRAGDHDWDPEPGLIGALRGPFPDVLTMPTGGISTANLGAWLAAGSLAVGASSELCSSAAIAGGEWERLRHNAIEFTDALARARASSSR